MRLLDCGDCRMGFHCGKCPCCMPEDRLRRAVEGFQVANHLRNKEKSMTKEKKAATPKVRTFQVVAYQATDKANLEKNKRYLDAASKKYAAVIVQQLVAAKEPVRFTDILEHATKKAEHGAKANVEANVRWYLNDLSKRGIIKSVDTKVEAASSAEARGAEA